jgi:hypothetical protein
MKLKFPIEKVILFLAASFAAYNFGLAGGYIEHTHFSIGGLIAGVVVNITLAIASSSFGSLKGSKRTAQAQVALVAMLFISPLLVSPVIFYSLPETFLGSWILRAVWAVAWPLVADLAIVLAGAVSGKGLISLSDAGSVAPAKASDAQRRSATLKSRSAKIPATLSDAPAKIYRCECGKTFSDRFIYSGHTRICATHKEIKAGDHLIPVQMPETRKAEKKK